MTKPLRKKNFVFPRLDRSVDWQTPPEIIEALGPFNLDPAASTRQAHPTAKIMLTKKDNGLAYEWAGRVWLNPPFDAQITPFMRAMAEHNNGIALVPCKMTAKWWKEYVWPFADSILFLSEKLHFYRGKRRDATPRSHADASEALIAYGKNNTKKLENSGIDGVLVT